LIEDTIPQLIDACTAYHSHLCPRQVLGLRIGLSGAAGLGLQTPREDKRLLAIVESDGCFADGVSIATSCSVGHRTLRVEDFGKVAATFIDVHTGRALRLAPHLDVRQRAWNYAPGETRHYFAQLLAYQVMPEGELLSVQEVQLTTPAGALISRPGVRIQCAVCGEEVINEREIRIAGVGVCRACAGQQYYMPQDALRADHSMDKVLENVARK